MRRRIGTITLQDKTTFHYSGYECAAWWKKVECHSQTVELWYSNEGYVSVSFTFYGKRVDDYFGSLWCGVPISKTPYVSHEIGKDDSHGCHDYAYNLIGLLLDRRYKVILDEDVIVTAHAEVLGRETHDFELKLTGGAPQKQSSFAHTAVFAKIEFAKAAAA